MTTTLAADLDTELAAAPTIPAESTGTIVLDLPLDLLVDNPANPRRDVGDVSTLADSIRSVGLLEPLVVVRAETYRAGIAEPTVEMDDGRYVLVAGHRRKAAARLAGLTEVPCVLREDLTGNQARLAMLLENLERSDLTVLEEAQAYAELVELELSQDEIAARVGRSQSHISKRLDLLKLPEEGRQLVMDKAITLDDARALIPLADQPAKLKAAAARKSAYGGITAAVKEQLKKDEDAALYQAARDKLTGEGKRLIKEPTGYNPYAYLGVGGYVESGNDKRPARVEDLVRTKRVKSKAAHRKLACHAYVVRASSDWSSKAGSAIEVCTKWTEHEAPIDQEKAARDAERAAYKAAVAMHAAAKQAHLQTALSAKKPAKALVEYALAAAVDEATQVHYHSRNRVVVELLGLPTEKIQSEGDARTALINLAETSQTAAYRVLAAHHAQRDQEHRDGSRTRALAGLLDELGYVAPGPAPQDPDARPARPARFSEGDQVVVTLAGADNGRTGTVAAVFTDEELPEYEIQFFEGEPGNFLEDELAPSTATELAVETDGTGPELPPIDPSLDEQPEREGQVPFEVGDEVTFTDEEYSDSRGVIRKIEDREDHNSPDSASYGVEVDGDKGVTTWFTADQLQHVAVHGCTGCGCSTDGPCATEGHCADADGYPTCELLEGDTTCSNCPGVIVETVEVAEGRL